MLLNILARRWSDGWQGMISEECEDTHSGDSCNGLVGGVRGAVAL